MIELSGKSGLDIALAVRWESFYLVFPEMGVNTLFIICQRQDKDRPHTLSL